MVISIGNATVAKVGLGIRSLSHIETNVVAVSATTNTRMLRRAWCTDCINGDQLSGSAQRPVRQYMPGGRYFCHRIWFASSGIDAWET